MHLNIINTVKLFFFRLCLHIMKVICSQHIHIYMVSIKGKLDENKRNKYHTHTLSI